MREGAGGGTEKTQNDNLRMHFHTTKECRVECWQRFIVDRCVVELELELTRAAVPDCGQAFLTPAPYIIVITIAPHVPAITGRPASIDEMG